MMLVHVHVLLSVTQSHIIVPTGPVCASRLLSDTLSRGTHPTLAGMRRQPNDGAMFVLTCGRGLINLRPGSRSSTFFSAPQSSVDIKEEEGCILAYEVEQ